MAINAKVIKHSKSAACGTELITLEIDFHRFILPELNTYRQISRNYQSSRAIPIERQIEMVRHDPAIPVFWGKNQPGMVANVECINPVKASCGPLECSQLMSREDAWLCARDKAVQSAKELHEAGYHKQIVNRLLEPFMYTKGIWTGTRTAYEHVFKQRIHANAQPEFKALAVKMKEVISQSEPQLLCVGDWHLPYVDSNVGTEENRIVSVSCCAQVSYRKLDDSLEKAQKIVSMLHLNKDADEPPHWSPTEHQACVDYGTKHVDGGNFGLTSFVQYRKMLGG